MIALLLILGAVGVYWKWLAAAVLAWVALRWIGHRRDQLRADKPQLAVRRAQLAARADEQHSQVLQGAAPWAATARNKFREAARSTDNPSTKLLAEGLTALAEALRELDDNMGKLEQQVRLTIEG